MKKLVIAGTVFLGLSFLGSGIEAESKQYVYKSATNDQVVTITEKVEYQKDRIIVFSITDEGQSTRTVCNPDFSVQTWEIMDQGRNTQLLAERTGNLIKLDGKFKGKTISKKIKVDAQPLWQTWELAFGAFVLSGERKAEFWCIRGTDLKDFRMTIFREREETIVMNGRKIETVKLKVTLSGWLSKFWSATYWFRKSDGVFVKSESVNGPTGTPATICELVAENA